MVWWWKGEASFVVILKDLQIADQNFEVNWVSLLEIKSKGSLWIRKRSFRSFLGIKKIKAEAGNIDFLIEFLFSFSLMYFFKARDSLSVRG